LQAPVEQVTMQEIEPTRVSIDAPGLPSITGRTDAFVGEPGNLTAGDQIASLFSYLRL
jgi:hypothetical protein